MNAPLNRFQQEDGQTHHIEQASRASNLPPDKRDYIRQILDIAKTFIPDANRTLIEEYKDKHIKTFLHAERDALLGYKLIKTYFPDRLNAIEITEYVVASVLHDMAKVSSDPTVLYRAGRLTKDEFEEHIKPHAQESAACIRKMPVSAFNEIIDLMMSAHNMDLEPLDATNAQHAHNIARIAEEHHEKLDGSGYPYGKRGSAISFAGCLLGLVDHYDGMTGRDYQPETLAPMEVLTRIEPDVGTKFDPLIFAALKNHVEQTEGRKKAPVVFHRQDKAIPAAIHPAFAWLAHLPTDYLFPMPQPVAADGSPAPKAQGALLCSLPLNPRVLRQPTRPLDMRKITYAEAFRLHLALK